MAYWWEKGSALGLSAGLIVRKKGKNTLLNPDSLKQFLEFFTDGKRAQHWGLVLGLLWEKKGKNTLLNPDSLKQFLDFFGIVFDFPELVIYFF